jgi:tetratricopeptide (TPR) repeat protein
MRKMLWVGVIAVLAIAVGVGVVWYVETPHTAAAQLAAAEKLEKEVRAEGAVKTVAELEPKIEKTVGEYQKVWTTFGKIPKDRAAAKPWPQVEAAKRIAKIHEEVEKDVRKALGDLEQLARDYAGEEDTEGYALLEQARLIRKQADDLKAEKKGEAEGRYKEALAKLEEFRKKFEKSPDAVKALMEIGRIWQDGIEEPPIHALETFEKVLKDYPHSTYEPEAIYRLAEQYEKIKEFTKAMDLYQRLLQEYPKCEFAADATLKHARLLAEEFDRHEEAAKEFEKFAQNYPEDPRAGGAAGDARSEKEAAAEDEGKKYGQARYGGRVPLDTSDDKPLPSEQMLKQFIAEKLDAETYDLNVALAPAEHRLTVNGTLKLTNRGEAKKELLLMLGAGMEVAKWTVDGAEAQTAHSGETLKVVLPTELAKDAETTLGFTYSGQYADAAMMKDYRPGPGGGNRGAQPGTTKPASAPSPAAATSTDSAPATSTAPTTTREKLTINPQLAMGDYGYGLSGAAWYPITIVGDVFDAHVTFTAPANVEAVSNGAVVARAKAMEAGKEGRFEFQTHNPVFGLYFAYGPYVVQDKQVGDIHFYTYFRPEHAGKHEGYVEVTNRILSFYASKYAPFPFEKMAVIEAPLPPFLGGVGPASLMFLQESMVDHPEVPETLLAHELAHQWFGNLIPINLTDPGYNQWLSEGFATYSDALYTEFKDGPKAFGLHIEKYQQLYFQLSLTAKPTAIRDTRGPMQRLYRPVVYEKGALVLHMLRKVMGDEKFFELMRRYVEEYRNKATNVDDFRKLATTVNGSDLSWFFAEWYDRTVYAHWTVNAAVTPDGAGGASTKVTVMQPDDLVTMPADVTLIGEKGDRVVVKDVMLDKKETVVEAKSPFVPVKVVVDEDNWVLKRPGEDNMWPKPVKP